MSQFDISKDPEFIHAMKLLSNLAEDGGLDMITVNESEIHSLMLSLEKADLSFQTMTQVRDQIFAAYQEMIGIEV
jgi:flagellar hook-basal body complex protein FliE